MSGRHHLNKFDSANETKPQIDKTIVTLLKYGWSTKTIASYLNVTQKRVNKLRHKYKYYKRNFYEVY